MNNEIPFKPIKEYESENMKKLLRIETYHSEFENSVSIAEMHKGDGVNVGETYSESVDLILEGMGLGKYVENFKKHDIGVNVLLHMTADDLSHIGVTHPKDLANFKKQLIEFNGGPKLSSKDVLKIEEDLIMARNIYAHLEDINAHLNFIRHELENNNFEDYFVTSKVSIIRIFMHIANRAITQAKRISELLFTGSLTTDNLVGACLKVDNLQLPQFMAVKLQNPHKEFEPNFEQETTWASVVKKTGTLLTICIPAVVLVFRKFVKK